MRTGRHAESPLWHSTPAGAGQRLEWPILGPVSVPLSCVPVQRLWEALRAQHRPAWSRPQLCCSPMRQQKHTRDSFGSLGEFLHENCPVPLLRAGSQALVILTGIWADECRKPYKELMEEKKKKEKTRSADLSSPCFSVISTTLALERELQPQRLEVFVCRKSTSRTRDSPPARHLWRHVKPFGDQDAAAHSTAGHRTESRRWSGGKNTAQRRGLPFQATSTASTDASSRKCLRIEYDVPPSSLFCVFSQDFHLEALLQRKITHLSISLPRRRGQFSIPVSTVHVHSDLPSSGFEASCAP